MRFTNTHTKRPFMDYRESLDVAMDEYPEFSRNEKKLIASLIQRRSFLESKGDSVNISLRKELAALRWVLNEINNFEEVDD